MLFALVNAEGAVLRYEDHDEQPDAAENKPQWRPVVGDAPACDAISEVMEGPAIVVSETEITRTWTVRPLDADELAARRAEKVAQIRAEAERRILAVMPEYEQRNSLALGMELVTTHGSDPVTWPADQRDIYTAAMLAWGQIKAIRAVSNVKEAALPSDAAGLAAVDPLAGWE